MDRTLRPSQLPTNYAADGERIQISDKQIRDAVFFEGWTPVFLEWPCWLWKDRKNGVPCQDVEKNAYHVQHLARVMAETGKWIGGPVQVDRDPEHLREGELWRCVDGSHRVRAAQYLETTGQLILEVPARGDFPPERFA